MKRKQKKPNTNLACYSIFYLFVYRYLATNNTQMLIKSIQLIRIVMQIFIQIIFDRGKGKNVENLCK